MTLSDSRQHRRPRRRRGRDPHAWAGLPSYPRHPSGVPCPLPRWTAAGASVGCFPAACSLPRNSGRSASTTSLSRPAQASLALRPVGLLNRPRRPSSRGFDPSGRPDRPLVSYQINRQLSGWSFLHWWRAPSGRTEFSRLALKRRAHLRKIHLPPSPTLTGNQSRTRPPIATARLGARVRSPGVPWQSARHHQAPISVDSVSDSHQLRPWPSA